MSVALPQHGGAPRESLFSSARVAQFRQRGAMVSMLIMLFWVFPLAIRLAVGPKNGALVAFTVTAGTALVIAVVLIFAFRDDLKAQRDAGARVRDFEARRRQTFKCISPQDSAVTAAGFPIRVRRRDASRTRFVALDEDAAWVELDEEAVGAERNVADGEYSAEKSLRALVDRVFEPPFENFVFNQGPTGLAVVVSRKDVGETLAQVVGKRILDTISLESGGAPPAPKGGEPELMSR